MRKEEDRRFCDMGGGAQCKAADPECPMKQGVLGLPFPTQSKTKQSQRLAIEGIRVNSWQCPIR